jgi:transcriptional regulator with XRE-family HTH domain
VAEGSPTVRRRELGTRLRELRKGKDLTVDQVAAHLECSASKISRIETGQRGAMPRDVRDLCDLYGVTEQAERDRLVSLAREGKQQGWWQSYDLPIPTYVGLEAEAVSIRHYDSAIIPGLVQTAEYAYALHDVVIPALEDAVIEKQVKARLMRQQRLTGEPKLEYHVILDEAALHRSIGGSRVMAAQLDRLANAARLPNVTVQVIPYSAGAHPALDSTFNILEFSGSLETVVYVEGLVGWIYIERPQDVKRYQTVFERLCAMALSPQESTDLVAKISVRHAERT